MIDWNIFSLLVGGTVIGSLALADRIARYTSQTTKVTRLALERLKRNRRVLVIRRGRTRATATGKPKPKPNSPIVVDWEDPYSGFGCPNCGLRQMYFKEVPNACACEQCDVVHMHVVCGTSQGKGCHLNFIMRGRDVGEVAQ